MSSFLIKLFRLYFIFVNQLLLMDYQFEFNKPKEQANELMRIVPRYDRHLRTKVHKM